MSKVTVKITIEDEEKVATNTYKMDADTAMYIVDFVHHIALTMSRLEDEDE